MGQVYGLVWMWAASMCLWMSRLSLLYFSQKRQLQYLTPDSTRQQVCSSMYSATLSCSTKTESVGWSFLGRNCNITTYNWIVDTVHRNCFYQCSLSIKWISFEVYYISFSHYTRVCFLFVVVHGMARGGDFATHLTLKSHVHMVGLNVPCHIVSPLIGVITHGTFEKPTT